MYPVLYITIINYNKGGMNSNIMLEKYISEWNRERHWSQKFRGVWKLIAKNPSNIEISTWLALNFMRKALGDKTFVSSDGLVDDASLI